MQYSDAEVASQFTHDLCQRVSYEASPSTDDVEMVVSWKVSQNKYQEAVHFLDRFGVGENLGSPSLVLTDPVVDHEPYPGVWRIVRNFYDARERAGVVFQVRRRGWLESIVHGGDLRWDEARLISGRDHTIFKELSEAVDDPVRDQTDDYAVFQWRNVNPDKMVELCREMVTLANGGDKTFTIFGEAEAQGAYADWRLLPPEYRREQDGSGSITAAFVRLGVKEYSFSGIGTDVESETISETVTEERAAKRVNDLKATGEYHSVSMQRSRESGMAVVRRQKVTPVAGFYEYEVQTEPGDIAYHRVAWEQPLNAQGLLADLNGWFPTDKGLTAANSIRQVGSVRRNPLTKRFSYHIVVTARGADIPIHPEDPLTSYRYREEKRSMWSIANNMYWDQERIVQVVVQVLQFASFAAAEGWIWEHAGGDIIIDGSGTPVSLPALVMVDTPMPRKVGKNRWLASRSFENKNWMDWFPAEPGS